MGNAFYLRGGDPCSRGPVVCPSVLKFCAAATYRSRCQVMVLSRQRPVLICSWTDPH